MSLSVVSLFSGIGLLDLGLERAGMTTRLLCEYDRAARSVLARRFPGVPIHPDVRELSANDIYATGADPARTVLAGGFPCQDVSVAGGRAGMGEGTRTGLYWHIVRLLADFPARWVLLENVPGLLSSHRGRDMGAVVGSLGELGYGIAWRVLDAQYAGVPQRRRRVAIVGHLGAPWGAPAQVLLEPEGSGGHPLPRPTPPAEHTAGATGGAGSARVANTLTAHHGRLNAEDLNNLVVGALTSSHGGADDNDAQAGHLVVSVTGPRTHALTAEGHDASEDGTGRGTPIIVAPTVADTLTAGSGAHAPGRRREDDANIVAFHTTQDPISGPMVPAIGSKSGGNGVATETVVRRLTPLECERLQGAPDGWTEGQADSPRYRQLGNGVAVPVFEWVARRLVDVDAALTVGGVA